MADGRPTATAWPRCACGAPVARAAYADGPGVACRRCLDAARLRDAEDDARDLPPSLLDDDTLRVLRRAGRL